MWEDLTNTIALVTGASSGIGRATARALAARGAHVALVARREERLVSLADEISESGGAAVVLVGDIVDHHQADNVIRRAVDHWGRLDIVVNNAGTSVAGEVADVERAHWRQMLDVNVDGLIHVTSAALPHLALAAAQSDRQVADLVTISSTAGRVARPGFAFYSLAKFGVNAFSESLRQEMLGKRVRVGVVEPGAVATEIGQHMPGGPRPTTRPAIEKLLPEDVADAVVYMVTRDRRVAINEMLVRAGDQTW